jgi:ADP-ribose pyrophosphatase
MCDTKDMLDSTLYEGHGWKVILETASLPDGRKKTVARAYACDTVHILAFDADGRILLLREFRPFYGEYVWMLPSGKVDKETDVAAAAQRELQEETGMRATSIEPYFVARNTERVPYHCHVFIARNLVRDPLPQDAEELIEVHALPLDQAIENVLGMPVQHAMSALALLRYHKDNQR